MREPCARGLGVVRIVRTVARLVRNAVAFLVGLNAIPVSFRLFVLFILFALHS